MSTAPGILLVGNHPPPFGGVPSHVQALSTHLASGGWNVHVLSAVGRVGSRREDGYVVHRLGEVAKFRNLARRPPRVGVAELLWRERAPLQGRLGLVSVANAITALARAHGLDVVSAYHLLSTALPASWATTTLQLPLISTVFGEIYTDPATHIRRRRDVEAIIDRSFALLSCSKHCAKSFRAMGLDTVADAVPYGVDMDRFDTATSHDARQALGLPIQASIVSFVGRMVEEMGTGVLLAAAPTLVAAGHHVVIAGATGDLTPAALATMERHRGQVHVLPDVAPDSLPLVYTAADVVVAPSTNDRACLGLAIIEAMASSRAVVGADVGGTGEVIVDGVTGTLVRPGDAQALADAVMSLIDSPEARADLGSAGRDRVAEQFDNRVVCARIEAILRLAIERE